MSTVDRIDRLSRPDERGCLAWQGRLNPKGYPLSGEHRSAYRLFYGAIPVGLVIDHVCRNRACVNPLHLDPVTQRENLFRSPFTLASKKAAQTHCVHGHDLTGAYICKNGTRQCRECTNIRRTRLRRLAVAS